MAYLTSRDPGIREAFVWVLVNFKVVQIAIGAGLVIAFAAVRFRLWEALCLCCFAMMALLAVGPDYRLVHWLIPTAAFIVTDRQTRWPRAYALLLGLLLIPKGMVIAGEVKMTALLNPLIMLAICGMVMTEASARHVGKRPCRLVLHRLKHLSSSLSRLLSRMSHS